MSKATDNRDKIPPIVVGKNPGPGASQGPIPIFSPPQMKPTPTESQTRLVYASLVLIPVSFSGVREFKARLRRKISLLAVQSRQESELGFEDGKVLGNSPISDRLEESILFHADKKKCPNASIPPLNQQTGVIIVALFRQCQGIRGSVWV